MPQISKQAYQNLMQASRKYATVTYSIRLPNKPRIYFKSKQACLDLKYIRGLLGKRIEYVTVAYLRLACIKFW